MVLVPFYKSGFRGKRKKKVKTVVVVARGKKRSTSKKVHYTKKGQPYIIDPKTGRAKFIPK
jgi:hypothetical protein